MIRDVRPIAKKLWPTEQVMAQEMLTAATALNLDSNNADVDLYLEEHWRKLPIAGFEIPINDGDAYAQAQKYSNIMCARFGQLVLTLDSDQQLHMGYLRLQASTQGQSYPRNIGGSFKKDDCAFNAVAFSVPPAGGSLMFVIKSCTADYNEWQPVSTKRWPTKRALDPLLAGVKAAQQKLAL